jgi:hypothetical protein
MSFTLVNTYGLSIFDIDNMIIWERDVYVVLLNNKIEKEKMKEEEKAAKNYMANV